jgi:hypothetical protein
VGSGALAGSTDFSSETSNPDDTNLPYNTPAAQIHADEYKVGWICALQVELDAAQRILDKVHARGFGHGMDNNLYILGQIGHCNIVITCLPKGQYGNNAAAVVATRMMNCYFSCTSPNAWATTSD